MKIVQQRKIDMNVACVIFSNFLTICILHRIHAEIMHMFAFVKFSMCLATQSITWQMRSLIQPNRLRKRKFETDEETMSEKEN